MDTTLIVLIAVIAFLLCTMAYLLFVKSLKKNRLKPSDKKTKIKTTADETNEFEENRSIYTDPIRNLAKQCEKKLIPEHRNLVKILIDKEFPELPAVLQIEDLKISIKRDHKNQSMFDVHNIIYALNLARCGHSRSTRCIPTRSELEYILAHREIINTYLKNMGLEQISDTDEFWFIDMPEGWSLNWANYKWDLSRAFDKLQDKFRILTPEGIKTSPSGMKTKLILLLKGWNDLFEEI